MATKKTTPSPVKAKAAVKPVAVKKSAVKKLTSKPVAKAVKATAKASQNAQPNSADLDMMFDLAAETFRVMSAPMRLKIINCLCTEEKNVGQLLDEIDTTQPNMSQHLNTLFKAKILGRRRDGVQIYYRIINERVVTLCRAVCTQIAIDSDIEHV
jgi:DNA-binding transcriptional ArsR family regulator